MLPRVRLPLLLAALFGLWELLFADFMADDFMQLAILEGVSPAAAWTNRLQLYTIADGNPSHMRVMQEAGLFPWFAAPDFAMVFLRPLSSLLLAGDHALFGLHPFGYRLHGTLWSLALVAAVAAILLRSLPAQRARLAVVLFVLSGIQAIFCWTAARHVIVAAALGFAAVAAHLRWRMDGWRAGAVLSLLALALSLAASEVGLAVAAYLIAYELCGATDRWQRRLSAVTPALLMLGIYLLIWQLYGHGASANTGYSDPVRAPVTFLSELAPRLAVLLGGTIFGGAADLWLLRPQLRGALAIAGALLTVGLAAILSVVWRQLTATERRSLRWLAVGSVASCLPLASAIIGSRLLIVPWVGAAALIAIVLQCWWHDWRKRSGWGYRALGLAGATLALLHLILAPLNRLAIPVLLQRGLAVRAGATLRDAEWNAGPLSQQTAVVLQAPDFVGGLHAGFYGLLHRLPMPQHWRVLSWAPAQHQFTRTSADTLEMHIDGEGLESPSLVAGSTVALGGMQATVVDTGKLGPTRVRFRFERDLDDPRLTLLVWRDGKMRRVAAPRLGAQLILPAPGFSD